MCADDTSSRNEIALLGRLAQFYPSLPITSLIGLKFHDAPRKQKKKNVLVGSLNWKQDLA